LEISVHNIKLPACIADCKGLIIQSNEAYSTLISKLAHKQDIATKNDLITLLFGENHNILHDLTNQDRIRKSFQEVALQDDYELIIIDENYLFTKDEITAQTDYRQMIKLFRDTVSEVYDSIIITDMSDTIIYVNKSFENLYGYTSDELIGLDSSEFWKKHQIIDERTNIRNFTITEGGFHGELLNVKKDGTVFPILLSTTMVYDEYGKPYGTVGLGRDITDEKRVQEQMNLSIMKAEEADRLKSNMMANMSHELRTPLTGIIGFASILIDLMDKDNDLYLYIESIKSSGERLLETLNNILMVSEIESNRTKIRFVQTTLSTTINKVFSFHKPIAKKAGLELKIEGETSFPVYTDELILYQVLNIILNNALKFTEKGGVTVKIFEKGKRTYVSIIDTGVGISEDFLEQMYEAFSQESAGIRRKFQGVGLGLNICKKYSEMIKATIDVESTVGVGTIFTVSLPQSDKK